MDILLISNLYPSKNFPSFGTFVKVVTDELEKNRDITIKKVVLDKEIKSKVIAYICFYLMTWINLLFNKKDLTYIHYISHSTIPLFFAPKPNNLVLNIHGSDIYLQGKKAKFFKFFIKTVLQKSDLVIVPSIFYQSKVIEIYNVSPEKIFVSPSGGIDTKVFYNKNNRAKGKVKFGYASRLEDDKGWDTFLDAVSTIKNDNVEFYMVGSGTYKNRIENIIENAHYDNLKLIELLPQKELAEFFNTIDCFIFPSKRESLGLVGLEAMACGCFVIGADNEGILSYLKDNDNGLVFKSGNAESLVNAIEEYLQMSENEKKRILTNSEATINNFAKEDVVALLYDKFENLIEENSVK